MRFAANVGKQSCVGAVSCQQAGMNRPYSYIWMYFLTSATANPLSCFNYLTGYDGNADIGNDSWYVVLMVMCLLFYL